MRLRRIGIGIILLVAVAAGWFAFRLHDERVFRAELERAKTELLAGHTAVARRMLADLARQRPGRGEVEFHLGICELLRGREDEALAAFRRVPADAEEAGWAAVHRAGILQKRGELARTETLLSTAVEQPGSQRSQARWELVRLLRLQGRFEEARRLFQEGLAEFEDPIAALRELYRLDVDPYAAEGVRRFLDAAGQEAPEDDRVWLGRAALATRSGNFEEADRWLRACLERRPDDPAVWRARLNWALAADRPEAARETLRHIPIDADSEARALELRAWFAARRDDLGAERSALESLRSLRPADPRVLDRLAELAIASGDPVRAEELRDRKADVEQAREDYSRLLRDPNARDHAAELARLARALGRRFDARQWSNLAAGRGVAPPQKPPVPPKARTLADLLPDLLANAKAPDPATAPIKEAPPNVHFTDSAEASGLRFIHESGASAGRLIPPITFSGGVGLLDFDNDGWLDVFLVQSGRFPPDPASTHDGDRLFRNRGDGTFEDVTDAAGLDRSHGFGHGVAVGDYDNDGFPDLFLTRWREYVLYRNCGDGTFADVTESAGFAGDRDWPTSAAFADLDGDGDLDLYVCHYLRWDEDDDRTCTDPDDPSQYHCNPRDFPALPDHVFRNDAGQFVDVTAEAGILDRDGRGLGVLAADLDGDGQTDLFVANDMTADYLFRSLGGFRFEEVAHASGVAANANGGYQAGMGVACGDLDGDGRLDLAVTNYYNESTSFFHQLGGGLFADHTAAIGLAAPSRFRLGFGLVLLDANNDGRLDLMSANGHVHDGRPLFPWKMPAQLLVGTASGRLADVTEQAGDPFRVPHIGRGLASGDLDNDGRIDAVLQIQDEPVVFLHNRSEAGHFLVLRLEGTASNRDAIGAVVTVTAGGHRQVVPRVGGGSYQSASDPRLHLGLGEATRVEAMEVRWPSGRVDRFEDLKADTGYRIREGEDQPAPLPGWPKSPSP